MKHPQARRDGLIVEKVEGETLVYDLDRHRAYCLNPAAAALWDSCDGSTDPVTLGRRIGERTGEAVDAAFVDLALSDLRRARLLDTGAAGPRGITRRELVRRAGLAAGVSLVAAIVAPTAAHAATGCTYASCIAGTAKPNCCCDNSGPPGQRNKVCRNDGGTFNCNGAPC